ncbi:hypothetical protein D3C75_1269400 [compost metagenome]
MAKRTPITFTKTYASEANAEKALDKFPGIRGNMELRYDIMPVLVDGKVRYGILFFGMSACAAGVHFHFNVVA